MEIFIVGMLEPSNGSSHGITVRKAANNISGTVGSRINTVKLGEGC